MSITANKPKLQGRIVRSDKEQPAAKLPELGKIRTGEKRKIPKRGGEPGEMVEIPTSLDYFKPTGKYAARFQQAYGDKPQSIGIIFVSGDISQVCNERFELRDEAGKLKAYGDGLNYYVYSNAEKKYIHKVADDDTKKATIESMGNWYCILTLRFVIPKINDVFGCWVLETKGINSSIPNIRDTFDQVYNTAGTVINVPFDLTVQKVTTQKPGDKSSFPVISLIPNLGVERLEDIDKYLKGGASVRDIKKFIEDKAKSSGPALSAGQVAKQLQAAEEPAPIHEEQQESGNVKIVRPGEHGGALSGEKPTLFPK